MKYCMVLLLLLVVGCGKGSLERTSGSVEIGNTTADYYASSDRVYLIIWHVNFQGSSTKSGSGESSAEYTKNEGSYFSTDGRGFQWTCETKDGRSGTVIISDVEYDLAEGNVFLVSDEQGTPLVSQLSCDVPVKGHYVMTRMRIHSLAVSDETIIDFVGRASPKSREVAED